MPLSNPSSISIASNSSTSTTPTSVPSSITSVPLLAARSIRKGATIWNNSTANLFLDLSVTASSTNFTARLSPGGYYELPYNYTGDVSGIWDGANGSALIREFT